MISLIAYSIASALTALGTDGVSARLAERARGHGGSPVVNLAKRLTYRPPKTGGEPQPTALLGPSPGDVTSPSGRAPDRIVPLPPPPPIAPIAIPAVPDEGTWQILATAAGLPVLRAAFLRADPLYTSYTTAVAWMDTRLLAFELHPGTSQPGGGPWPLRSSLPMSDRAGGVVLKRAGAVRAMELDINATWTTFIHYGARADPTSGAKLLPTMARPVSVYETTSSRDFIVARAR